jgi:hypothetical protein
MSETMGFSHPSPHCFPPCAPFPPPHGCRRLYRSCSGIVPPPRSVPPSICVLPAPSSLPRGPRHRRCPGPPHDSRRPKVRAPAPLSPALYHVLPRTSPFSNINVCSVFLPLALLPMTAPPTRLLASTPPILSPLHPHAPPSQPAPPHASPVLGLFTSIVRLVPRPSGAGRRPRPPPS